MAPSRTPPLRPSLRFRGGIASPGAASASTSLVAQLRGSGVLTAAAVPLATSCLVLGLLFMLSSSAATARRRGDARSTLAITAVGALLLFAALQLTVGGPAAPLGAALLAASWTNGRRRGPLD